MHTHWFYKIASVFAILMLAFLFLPVAPAAAVAATFSSIADGDWTVAGTWDGPHDGRNVPNSGDSVVINATHTVSLTGDVTLAGSLTINSGGELVTNNYGLTLAGDFINNG